MLFLLTSKYVFENIMLVVDKENEQHKFSYSETIQLSSILAISLALFVLAVD